VHPHGLRAGEYDAVHAGVPPQRFARDLPRAREIVEHAGWDARVAVHLVQLETGPRCLLGRLVDDGVARHKRRRGHARGQGERKVEGRDAGEHAVGTQHVGVPLDGGHLRHLAHEAVRVRQLLAIVVDQVGGLLGVPHRLQPALADL